LQLLVISPYMFAKKMFVPFLTFFGLGVFVFGSQEHFDLDPDPKLLSKSFTRPLEILNLEFWKMSQLLSFYIFVLIFLQAA